MSSLCVVRSSCTRAVRLAPQDYAVVGKMVVSPHLNKQPVSDDEKRKNWETWALSINENCVREPPEDL